MLDPNNAGFENKLLAKIKEEKINPKPRWQFLLKDCVIWSAGIISLLIGAGAVSVMIYLFRFNDWEIYEQTKKSFLEFFVLTLPYFWIVFLGLFVFIISYNLKHTKKGYRYSLIIISGASILISIFLGAVFYVAGLGEKLDNILGSQAPFYDRMINRHLDFWSNPHEGRLSGLVAALMENGQFILIDRSQEEWVVSVKKSSFSNGAVIVLGQPIRVLGKEGDDHYFRADIILPLNAGRGFFRRLDGIPPHTRPGMLAPGMPFMAMPAN